MEEVYVMYRGEEIPINAIAVLMDVELREELHKNALDILDE